MAITTNPRKEYLLRASLEELHAQSQDYMKEIAFMKEEISFFNKLLNRNAGLQFPTEKSARISEQLISFVGDTFKQLRKKVTEHERLLADIMKTDTLGRQESYREIHRDLAKEMELCRKKFVRLKKKVFGLAKN